MGEDVEHGYWEMGAGVGVRIQRGDRVCLLEWMCQENAKFEYVTRRGWCVCGGRKMGSKHRQDRRRGRRCGIRWYNTIACWCSLPNGVPSEPWCVGLAAHVCAISGAPYIEHSVGENRPFTPVDRRAAAAAFTRLLDLRKGMPARVVA